MANATPATWPEWATQVVFSRLCAALAVSSHRPGLWVKLAELARTLAPADVTSSQLFSVDAPAAFTDAVFSCPSCVISMSLPVAERFAPSGTRRVSRQFDDTWCNAHQWEIDMFEAIDDCVYWAQCPDGSLGYAGYIAYCYCQLWTPDTDRGGLTIALVSQRDWPSEIAETYAAADAIISDRGLLSHREI